MRMVGSRSANGPQLQTRIRRWRSYQPAANPNSDNGLDADETTPRTSSGPSARPLRKGLELEFINIAHPHDATSSTAISSIRSHAARDIHASRRASASQPRVERRIRMRVETDGDSHLNMAWPVDLMIPIYNDLFNCCARPITKLEHFLLAYYAKSVIPNARIWCPHGDEESLFLEGVRLYWLPFVITDTALLAGIFLSSCRNLALHGCHAEANYDYSQIATMYKLECIRYVNAAIAAERPIINETIIAITLLLCADDFICKNLNASVLHFQGINKMIKLKGGLSNLGTSWFLGKALEWCNLEMILKTDFKG
ncbi:uncharacterized protein TrAFT101_004833 [Trichoderma asperellum]|nr:hypothetical protein TrAFT101_004833 [Trichoderma asperellum]